jgi:CRP-like cAMP-binding protein
MRRRNRAKGILTLQKSLREQVISKGEYIYKQGEEGFELFIVEEGELDVSVDDFTVFTVRKGELCGEYALIFGRPRNTSARCTTDRCKLQAMDAKDFKKLIRSNPSVREGLHETALRRQFQKALVFAIKKSFPTREEELKEAFHAVDCNHSGEIDLSDVAVMLKNMDSSFTNKDIAEILNSLDLDDNGSISWDEFKRIFGMNGTRFSNRY